MALEFPLASVYQYHAMAPREGSIMCPPQWARVFMQRHLHTRTGLGGGSILHVCSALARTARPQKSMRAGEQERALDPARMQERAYWERAPLKGAVREPHRASTLAGTALWMQGAMHQATGARSISDRRRGWGAHSPIASTRPRPVGKQNIHAQLYSHRTHCCCCCGKVRTNARSLRCSSPHKRAPTAPHGAHRCALTHTQRRLY